MGGEGGRRVRKNPPPPVVSGVQDKRQISLMNAEEILRPRAKEKFLQKNPPENLQKILLKISCWITHWKRRRKGGRGSGGRGGGLLGGGDPPPMAVRHSPCIGGCLLRWLSPPPYPQSPPPPPPPPPTPAFSGPFFCVTCFCWSTAFAATQGGEGKAHFCGCMWNN